jgi:predicted Zn-dependent protease
MKATKEPDFRVCPNCGARNKAKWEYCVKCSESLQSVPLGGASPPAVETTGVIDDDDGDEFPWGSVAAAVVALAVGFGIYKAFQDPAPKPPADLFTMGTIPPSLPPVRPRAPRAAGSEEYEAGLRRLNADDPAGAAHLFAQAVAAASDNHVYRHAYAVALWQSGAKAESIEEYRSALRVAPDNPTYRLNLAKALASIGRNTEALAEYEGLIRRGNHLEAMQGAARLLAESDPQKSQDFLRRVAAARPGDAVLKQQLASMLEKSGDTGAAKEMYSEILAQNPGAHITRGLLAEIQLKAGQPDEAVALFRAGLQQYPNVPLLHRGLASALERSGAVTEAINAYREYVRLAPNAPDAQQLRERADRLEKQVTAAPS